MACSEMNWAKTGRVPPNKRAAVKAMAQKYFIVLIYKGFDPFTKNNAKSSGAIYPRRNDMIFLRQNTNTPASSNR